VFIYKTRQKQEKDFVHSVTPQMVSHFCARNYLSEWRLVQ